MSDPSPSSPTPPSRTASVAGGFLAGTILTIALSAGAVWSERDNLRRWLTQDRTAELATLQAQLESLQQKQDQAPAPVPLSSTLPADIGERLAQIDQRLDALKQAVPPDGLILGLSGRIDQLDKELHGVMQQQATSQALFLGIGQLRDAVDRGDQFTVELAALRRQLRSDEAALLDHFADGAGSGIPRREQLLQQFAPLVGTLLHQEAASKGPGFWRIIGKNLQAVLSVRRMDGKGNDAEAVLGRAEAALDHGDWDQAVREMKTLPGPFETTAAPWIRQAELRLAADRALSQLVGIALARTAPN